MYKYLQDTSMYLLIYSYILSDWLNMCDLYVSVTNTRYYVASKFGHLIYLLYFVFSHFCLHLLHK